MGSGYAASDFDCGYVLFEDRSPDEVAAILGDPSLTVTTTGPPGRWTLVVDPEMRLGDAKEDLSGASLGGRVVRLLLIEAELFSHATHWSGGHVLWEVSFEGELDEVPSVRGSLPAGVLVSSPGTDPLLCFSVAVTAVAELTGWAPGAGR